MNSVVNMVNYYLIHKNADDSVIEYIKNKLNNSKIDEIIIIQIELLYTDPSDKLVSELVNYINNKINEILKDITIFELINLISTLKYKVNRLKLKIEDLQEKNNYIFKKIKEKDLNKDNIFDDKDSLIASDLINESQSNNYLISRKKSEINSIKIWLTNLENSYKKRLVKADIEELLYAYINTLSLLNRDEYINNYINELSNEIDKYILNSNLLDTIVNIMPELDMLYKNNSKLKNEIYKLLDYYIDMVENKIKESINCMYYEERIILKDKINLICQEILDNDNPNDDFKVLVISSYLRYL